MLNGHGPWAFMSRSIKCYAVQEYLLSFEIPLEFVTNWVSCAVSALHDAVRLALIRVCVKGTLPDFEVGREEGVSVLYSPHQHSRYNLQIYSLSGHLRTEYNNICLKQGSLTCVPTFSISTAESRISFLKVLWRSHGAPHPSLLLVQNSHSTLPEKQTIWKCILIHTSQPSMGEHDIMDYKAYVGNICFPP